MSIIVRWVKFFTKEHKPIFDGLIKLYENNSKELDEVAKLGGGRVQTKFLIMNYKIRILRVKELSPNGNMFPLTKKEMFSHNWQDGDG